MAVGRHCDVGSPKREIVRNRLAGIAEDSNRRKRQDAEYIIGDVRQDYSRTVRRDRDFTNTGSGWQVEGADHFIGARIDAGDGIAIPGGQQESRVGGNGVRECVRYDTRTADVGDVSRWVFGEVEDPDG